MSDTRLVTIAVAGAVGGVVGGLVVWALARTGAVEMPSAKPEAAASSVASGQGGAGPGGVASRLELLEARLASVQGKDRARSALAAYNAAAARGDDLGAGGADTRLAPVIDQDDATFEQAVRGVMDRINEEREAQRILRGQNRARALTDLLASELQLTDAQRPDVERILGEQHTAFRELRHPPADAGVERPVTRRQWRERIGEIREQTERELVGVLDEGQMQRYREINEEEGIGPGFGRRGGGDRRRRDADPAKTDPAAQQ